MLIICVLLCKVLLGFSTVDSAAIAGIFILRYRIWLSSLFTSVRYFWRVRRLLSCCPYRFLSIESSWWQNITACSSCYCSSNVLISLWDTVAMRFVIEEMQWKSMNLIRSKWLADWALTGENAVVIIRNTFHISICRRWSGCKNESIDWREWIRLLLGLLDGWMDCYFKWMRRES